MLEKIKESISFLIKIKFSKVRKNENILVYGISRGGSTMLAEGLVKGLNARLVWEPLFPYKKTCLKYINPYSTHNYSALEMGWSPHVNNHNEEEVNTYFDRFFDLKERNIRFFRFTDFKKFKSQDKTIIKFCFGNYLYPYLNDRYQYKSIILLRHPFAIAASSLRFGENYNWHKENFSQWRGSENKWSKGFREQFEDKLYLIKSPFTLLVFQSVAQFYFILNSKSNRNTKVVFYEDLVLREGEVITELSDFFGNTFNSEKFKTRINKQSFSSKEGHTLKDPIEQLSKWKTLCSKGDIEDGLEIFKAFNFLCYSEDILPIVEDKIEI